MYECLFYNGWVDPPGYELLEIDTRKFGESPQEILANPEFKRAVEKCMKIMVEDIDWNCVYLLDPDSLIRCPYDI